MSGSTISTTIAQTVTLGSASYASPLTVTGSGAVTPLAAGATAVISTLTAAYLDNLGTIRGANNTAFFSGAGGFGVTFASAGTLVNAGTISSGTGASGNSDAGVYIGSAVIVNNGSISSGFAHYVTGEAVGFKYGSLLNYGVIAAGSSGNGNGGAAVFTKYGTVTNQGTIRGGHGSVGGGYGLRIVGTGAVVNTGLISAGTGTGFFGDFDGVYLNAGSLFNTGVITGGQSTYGGTGLFLKDQNTINNQGTISGGSNNVSGIGINLNGANIITNGAATDTSALIIGDTGVQIHGTSASSLVNFATIAGRNNGIYLQQTVSSTITNAAGGTITGAEYGITFSGSAGAVINAGTIRATTGAAVGASGYVSNSSTGYIYGYSAGIGAATVVNAGRVVGGNDPIMVGVNLSASGTLTNAAGALIRGNEAGVGLGSGSVYNAGTIAAAGIDGNAITGIGYDTIINSGTIIASNAAADGVKLATAGTVTNISSSALIIGVQDGVWTQNELPIPVTVINAGTILATGTTGDGILIGAGGTVVNAGTIAGSGAALDFAGQEDNLLVVDPGAVFTGAVEGDRYARNTLELAAGGQGSITGIGTQFTYFGSITFDAGATWYAEGNTAGLAAGQTISGFAPGDTIILDGFTENGFSYVSGAGLELTGDGAATIDLAGSFSTGSFNVQTVAAGTEITQIVSGPVIGGAYTSPQAVTDGQGFAAFGNVTISDASASGPLTATITMTNTGAATDDDGTLTGAGLSKTATGTYTLTAASPADLQAALRAVVFTPGIINNTGVANRGLVTGLTLQVSDGVAPAATDRNTVIYTLPGSQPLSLAFIPVPGAPNDFTSSSRSGETTSATTPVTQITDTSATTITAVLNGQQVFQESFSAPYSDPTVQAAVAQADEILAGDGATAGAPALTSSQVTDGTPQIATLLTGETITGSIVSVNDYFGPGQVFGELDVNGTPNSTYTLLAGQEDTNVNVDIQQTIDQTVITTNTQLTSQDYTITGTPESATCFAAGTEILTVNGPVAVQNLNIGDLLPTLYGGAERIKWIGQRRYDGRFIAGNHLALPICIKPNALADGIPSHNLTVSPGHGIFIDGVLIPAWRLINGASITQAAQVDEIHYFQIELETHNIIFAHACPAESFLDEAGLRGQFHNAAEFSALYPQGSGSITSCVPRIESGELLQRIQNRIAARAGIAPAPPRPATAIRGGVDAIGPDTIYGWAQDIAAPEAALFVDAWGGGKLLARGLANHYRADLRLAGIGSGCHGFEILLPPGYRGPITIRHASTPLEHGEFIVPVQQRIAPAIRGYVDAISPEKVYGWAQDIAAPEAPLAVDLWSEGRLLARALANRYRPDLRRAGLGSGRHGFEIPIPPGTTGAVTIRHGATPLAQPSLHTPAHAAA